MRVDIVARHHGHVQAQSSQPPANCVYQLVSYEHDQEDNAIRYASGYVAT